MMTLGAAGHRIVCGLPVFPFTFGHMANGTTALG